MMQTANPGYSNDVPELRRLNAPRYRCIHRRPGRHGAAWAGAPALENGEPLPEGEILEGQLRAVREEDTEEQEDDSEDGHWCLPLGKLADRSG